tara:strand:- start:378 stop:1241 length:864 start_codon:yes stop_codon:yes gene_type:complete
MIVRLQENISKDSLLETNNHFTYIQNPNELFVYRTKSILVSILFLFSISSGCMSFTNNTNEFTFVVNYEKTNGTIIESFVDGELISKTNVTLKFDFSNTISENRIIEFGIEFKDDRAPIIVNPKNDNEIIVDFYEHGIYEINAYATDQENNIKNVSIIIRIETKIEWLEQNTFDPIPLIVDSIPKNNGNPASSIIIDSNVENPALIENVGGGREVKITWALIDQQDDSCQSKKGLVQEGENLNWKTIHFNTFEIHELRIIYEEGQDSIDINQTVLIEYSPIESEPNY